MSKLPKVLMSSDNLSTGLLWRVRLEAKTFQLVLEPNFSLVAERSLAECPDLILLEPNPFDEKVYNMLLGLREEQAVPILVLLTIHEADLTLKVYEAGADDCIVKPIEAAVLIAKINAWLNRCVSFPTELLKPLRVGKLNLFPAEKLVSLDNGSLISLTSLETRLLYVLMRRAGRTITSEELIQLVWRDREILGAETLKNMIYRLRSRLKDEPANLDCIVTVPGIGYKFELGASPPEPLEG